MFLEIRNQLLSLQQSNASREFTPGTFTRLIRSQFDADDYVVRTEKNNSVDLNTIIIAGLYDSYNDRQQLPHTDIILQYNTKQTKFSGSDVNWDQLSFDIAECVEHERVHRNQFWGKVKFKKYSSKAQDIEVRLEQNYLGHEEEIDAYGFSIAAEAYAYNRPYSECAMYRIYERIFDTDRSVVVKLKQEIVKYLEQLKLEPNNEQDHNGNRRSASR
jgi:hypothetical protein